jgi:hypothetical protein
MRRTLGALIVVALVAGAAAPRPAIDRATAVARAREVRDRVSRGDMAPLWSQFHERMRTVLKDSASFSAMSTGIHAQTGAVDSVLDEEVFERDSLLVVRARCRFTRMPVPGLLTVGFTPDGRIGTLSVRPDPTTEAPSKYLDYQPKARFELPFRGEWLVFWGGRTLGENYHAVTRAQRFAHDIVMVKDGKTHTGDGKALTDYHCYGQPILAPAAGVVVTAVDSLPDQAIGSRDPAHAAGNHVVIDHGNGEFSLLAHLQPHAVKVKAGQKVKAGDVLGLTGNSGNTSEPHLHVHLMNGPSMDGADGLPMPFSDYVLDGRLVERGELKRFQLVKRPER